jgi:hypothetical protein
MQNAADQSRALPMSTTAGKIVIKGLTKDGKKFRPSDWAERLTSAVATTGRGRRVIFHPKVHMVTVEGVSCVVVDADLEQSDPMLFGFLMNFGIGNNLQISRGEAEPQS